MPKERSSFVCVECGYESPRWLGKCPECASWNTLVEEKQPRPAASSGRADLSAPVSVPLPIAEIDSANDTRQSTRIAELDRVLGGGLVTGSLILVSGEPGIGKSTLILQTAYEIAHSGSTVLYVSGEESAKQVKMRAERIGALDDRLLVVAESNLAVIRSHCRQVNPGVLIIDSVQTVYDPDISSAPGSVSQIREVTGQLLLMSKQTGTSIFVIGHVTKSGAIAGPRVLEHMVDTVVYFEGDRHHSYRILRTVKNRFGSTNEIGVFEMGDKGLVGVDNPSALFLSGESQTCPGSAVTASLEGTRPILVEIQALVAPAGFGTPRRTVTGVDYNRTAIILAVLEKRAGLSLANEDVFVSAAGGVKVSEPSTDLGTALAVASSFRNKLVPRDTIAVGEVGLSGEIRSVSRCDARVAEAAKLGFKRCLVPRTNARSAAQARPTIDVIGVATIEEALSYGIEG